jgi:hypothetical protein
LTSTTGASAILRALALIFRRDGTVILIAAAALPVGWW